MSYTNGHNDKLNGHINGNEKRYEFQLDEEESWISKATLDFPALSCSYSPIGNKLAIGESGSKIRIWDIKSDHRNPHILEHGSSIEGLCWHPDSMKTLASISSDKRLVVWNVVDRKINFEILFDKELVNIHWSKDGKLILVSDKSDKLSLVNYETKSKGASFQLPQTPELNGTTQINQFTLTKDLKKLIIASNNGYVHFFNLENFEFITSLRISSSTCHSLDLHPSGNYLCVGTADATASLIDLQSFKIIVNYSDLYLTIRSIKFNHDGQYVAMCSRQSMIYIYNTFTGKLQGFFETLQELNNLNWHSKKNILVCVGDSAQDDDLTNGVAFILDLEKFSINSSR
jgi:WD40 repeat protein